MWESILDNEWDEYAQSWDVDPSVAEYAKNAFNELTKNVNIDDLTVLDFGCGTGSLTQLLSPRVNNIVAIDPSSEMINFLQKKGLTNVLPIADYLSDELRQAHPELENKFDLIVASSVCSFLPDYEATLSLLTSLLKPDATFVQWDWLSEEGTSTMGLSKQRVNQALLENGFIKPTISTPFTMNSSKGNKPVLMAIAKKA